MVCAGMIPKQRCLGVFKNLFVYPLAKTKQTHTHAGGKTKHHKAREARNKKEHSEMVSLPRRVHSCLISCIRETVVDSVLH